MKYLYWDLVLNNPKRIEIYLSGCKEPHCKNCQNPESWDFDNGNKFDDSFFNKLYEYENMYDHIWILGGEPLDQLKDDFILLLDRLYELNKNIWLFTRYELDEIDVDVLEYCNFVKTGKFIADNSPYISEYGFELASKNQKIIKINTKS